MIPGLFDIPGQIRKAINDFFAWIVEGALNPVLSALGEAVLTTPDLAGDERVRTMWTTSLVVVNAIFVLFIVVAGIVVASRETLQTSYGLKEIAPHLAVAGALMNTSLLLTGKAIELTNAVTAAIAGQGVDGHAASAALTPVLQPARSGRLHAPALRQAGGAGSGASVLLGTAPADGAETPSHPRRHAGVLRRTEAGATGTAYQHTGPDTTDANHTPEPKHTTADLDSHRTATHPSDAAEDDTEPTTYPANPDTAREAPPSTQE